jgi:hypothetical protein
MAPRPNNIPNRIYLMTYNSDNNDRYTFAPSKDLLVQLEAIAGAEGVPVPVLIAKWLNRDCNEWQPTEKVSNKPHQSQHQSQHESQEELNEAFGEPYPDKATTATAATTTATAVKGPRLDPLRYTKFSRGIQ